jgi:hypothetical protein
MHFSIAPTATVPGLQARIDGKTKPPGSLGQLERLALQVGQVQQSLTPSLDRPRLLVFAGDHGAARAGVSAYPQEVTWQMVENFLSGGAAINVFARLNGLELQVIDAGVAHDFGARQGLVDAKIAFGTRSYLEQAAMSSAERDAALVRGAAIVHAPGRTGLPGDRLWRDGDREYRRRLAADPLPDRHAIGGLRRTRDRPRRCRTGAQAGTAGASGAASGACARCRCLERTRRIRRLRNRDDERRPCSPLPSGACCC